MEGDRSLIEVIYLPPLKYEAQRSAAQLPEVLEELILLRGRMTQFLGFTVEFAGYDG